MVFPDSPAAHRRLIFIVVAVAVGGFALTTPVPAYAQEKHAASVDMATPPAAAGNPDGVYLGADGKVMLKAHVKKNKLTGRKKGDDEDDEDDGELRIGALGQKTPIRLPVARPLECRIGN